MPVTFLSMTTHRRHRFVARFIAGELVKTTHSASEWLKIVFGRELRGEVKAQGKIPSRAPGSNPATLKIAWLCLCSPHILTRPDTRTIQLCIFVAPTGAWVNFKSEWRDAQGRQTEKLCRAIKENYSNGGQTWLLCFEYAEGGLSQ